MHYPNYNRFLFIIYCAFLGAGLVSCSDSDDETTAPTPETAAPVTSEDQLTDALKDLAEQSAREGGAETPYGFRLPYTTYQVVGLISRLTGEFSVLQAAVESAGLVGALNGDDALTVFAPTNAAFARMGLDEEAVRALDRETLANLLKYHITTGNRFSDELRQEQTITMLNGGTAQIDPEGKQLFINDAQLFTPFLINLPTRNGVIHIINSVLKPTAPPMTTGPVVTGLAYAPTKSATTAADALHQVLESNPDIGVVARVDHAANAASVGQELRPTEVILFGNPTLGTLLMQLNQSIGIDLPQKVLFYENEAGEAYAAYNTTAYLASRHGIPVDSATLPMIEMALKGLVEGAAGNAVVMPNSSEVKPSEGLVVKSSSYTIETTYRRLVDAINAVDPLQIIAELDHKANAKRVGLELRPTKLLVFGNPNVGTPLMQIQPTMGIDLPQKMLVWEDADHQVHVAYNDPYYLAERHGLPADQEQLATIAGALQGLAEQATE